MGLELQPLCVPSDIVTCFFVITRGVQKVVLLLSTDPHCMLEIQQVWCRWKAAILIFVLTANEFLYVHFSRSCAKSFDTWWPIELQKIGAYKKAYSSTCVQESWNALRMVVKLTKFALKCMDECPIEATKIKKFSLKDRPIKLWQELLLSVVTNLRSYRKFSSRCQLDWTLLWKLRSFQANHGRAL